jgi:flavin-dependent dehydrogenase
LGETLPPTSIGLVKHFLGDPEGPEQQLPGLFSTAGNVSLWATEQADPADFFFTSTGHGLCVDRLAFDEALRANAVAAGATLLRGVGFQSCERIAEGSFNWQLTLISGAGAQQHRARYLVDCSGRQAVVARSFGVPTVPNDDRLFAYAQWFSCTSGDDDRYTRIEAAPHGWWYSNRLPGTDGNETRRLVVLHTDKDLPTARMAACRQGFEQLLDDSTHIAPLLRARGYHPCGTIRGAPANSQRLRDFCGDAWMAVGDAAQAYDPLSSQGIDKALRTASHAGHMIHYALTDCPQGTAGLDSRNAYLHQYDEQQRQLWQAYLSQRDFYYGIQPRWSDQPFWQRRRQLANEATG